MHRTALTLRLLLVTAAVAGLGLTGLAGCNQKAAGPFVDPSAAVGPEAIDYAPPVESLPAGPRLRVGEPAPDAHYGWAENARYLNYAFAEGRPDYVYAYDDYDVWGWESDNGWRRVVEPLNTGERYYYYRPEEDFPFFVVDDGYGYGFDDGALMAVYDPAGRAMPRSFVSTRSDYAARYLRRGRELELAREAAARRTDIDAAAWSRRQARLAAEEARLERAALQQAPWDAFRRRAERERLAERRPLEAERLRRLARRADRTDARVRADAIEDLAGVPRRDDNPGVSKRSPRATEAHLRNAERKALRDAERAEDDRRRGKGKGKAKGHDKIKDKDKDRDDEDY